MGHDPRPVGDRRRRLQVAGRQRIAGTSLTHASVVVDDGGVVASRRSWWPPVSPARRLTFMAGPYSPAVLFGSAATELRLEGEGQPPRTGPARVHGVGILRSTRDPPPRRHGGRRPADGRNRSRSISGRGAPSRELFDARKRELAAGSSASVAVPRAGGDFGMTFVDALMNRDRIWEDPAQPTASGP